MYMYTIMVVGQGKANFYLTSSIHNYASIHNQGIMQQQFNLRTFAPNSSHVQIFF